MALSPLDEAAIQHALLSEDKEKMCIMYEHYYAFRLEVERFCFSKNVDIKRVYVEYLQNMDEEDGLEEPECDENYDEEYEDDDHRSNIESLAILDKITPFNLNLEHESSMNIMPVDLDYDNVFTVDDDGYRWQLDEMPRGFDYRSSEIEKADLVRKVCEELIIEHQNVDCISFCLSERIKGLKKKFKNFKRKTVLHQRGIEKVRSMDVDVDPSDIFNSENVDVSDVGCSSSNQEAAASVDKVLVDNTVLVELTEIVSSAYIGRTDIVINRKQQQMDQIIDVFTLASAHKAEKTAKELEAAGIQRKHIKRTRCKEGELLYISAPAREAAHYKSLIKELKPNG